MIPPSECPDEYPDGYNPDETQMKQKKQKELKEAQDAGFSTVSEHKKYLRKKQREKKRKEEKKLALASGFSSVSEYKRFLEVKRRADGEQRRQIQLFEVVVILDIEVAIGRLERG